MVKSTTFWRNLDAAKVILTNAFSSSGVRRVEFVVGFGNDDSVWVWLGTTTDAERDALGARPTLAAEVIEILGGRGLEIGDTVTVQSEEAVTREYEGSWFYAMR